MNTQVAENKICEGSDCLKAALSSDMANLRAMVASARSVGWGSNEAVTLLCLVLIQVLYYAVCKHKFQKHY